MKSLEKFSMYFNHSYFYLANNGISFVKLFTSLFNRYNLHNFVGFEVAIMRKFKSILGINEPYFTLDAFYSFEALISQAENYLRSPVCT